MPRTSRGAGRATHCAWEWGSLRQTHGKLSHALCVEKTTGLPPPSTGLQSPSGCSRCHVGAFPRRRRRRGVAQPGRVRCRSSCAGFHSSCAGCRGESAGCRGEAICGGGGVGRGGGCARRPGQGGARGRRGGGRGCFAGRGCTAIGGPVGRACLTVRGRPLPRRRVEHGRGGRGGDGAALHDSRQRCPAAGAERAWGTVMPSRQRVACCEHVSRVHLFFGGVFFVFVCVLVSVFFRSGAVWMRGRAPYARAGR